MGQKQALSGQIRFDLAEFGGAFRQFFRFGRLGYALLEGLHEVDDLTGWSYCRHLDRLSAA